jgi:hypothetical protein
VCISRSNFGAIRFDTNFLCHLTKKETTYICMNMCDLCKLEDKTEVYVEEEKYIILECDSCFVPMAVWKEHTMSLSKEDEVMLERVLNEVAQEFYQLNEYYIDKNQRSILDHLHWHARLGSRGWSNKSNNRGI